MRTDDDPSIQVDRLRELLRRLGPQTPSAAPDPPPELIPRTRGASLPLEHLLHGCTINLMDA
jgi:hypothetical protein